MAIRHNKKGIFFTFIAVLLIMVLTTVFKPETELSFNKDIPVIKTRVTKINDFVTDFENVYLPNIMKLTTYRALTALTYYMDVTDVFLIDLQEDFKEVFLYGTINNNQIDDIISEDIMKNNTCINWTNRVKESAEDALNLDLNFDITGVNIYQTTPWLIDINLTLDYSVSSETANWTRNNVLIKTKLSIDNLYDPLYYVITDGNYKKKINQTDIKFGEWNTNNLSNFIDEEEYVHWKSSNALNFLMRFTEDFSASECCGIESAVNPVKLELTPLNPDQEEIYLDYLFFNTANGPYPCPRVNELYYIDNPCMDPRFKLDWNNVVGYNVTDDAVELPCP